MRKSDVLCMVLFGQLTVAALLLAYGSVAVFQAKRHLASESALVKGLMLTDLALFTEARYTRHLSQADLHTPFQDFPLALEHFPSGSLVLPAAGHYGKKP